MFCGPPRESRTSLPRLLFAQGRSSFISSRFCWIPLGMCRYQQFQLAYGYAIDIHHIFLLHNVFCSIDIKEILLEDDRVENIDIQKTTKNY